MFFGLQIKGENGWMMMECKNRKESPKPRLDEWCDLLVHGLAHKEPRKLKGERLAKKQRG